MVSQDAVGNNRQVFAACPCSVTRVGYGKTGKARGEQMFSALPPKADITLRTRHVSFVPQADIGTWSIT
jgi:hypothetical protein